VPVKQGSWKSRISAARLEESVYVELLRTGDILARGISQVLKTADLSSTQYNVLRILRGAPEGLLCGEIADRMITRDPDITRLLDRLERRGLISRCRGTKDRRMVLARITTAGLRLLGRLDVPVQQAHTRQLRHVGRKRLELLAALLRVCRDEGKSS
jgi:DNA-binding MarR family transcriptional regulator